MKSKFGAKETHEPIVLLGDLNVDSLLNHDLSLLNKTHNFSEEYIETMKYLKSFRATGQDLMLEKFGFRVPTFGINHQEVVLTGVSELNSNQSLDYIIYFPSTQPSHFKMSPDQVRIETFKLKEPSQRYINPYLPLERRGLTQLSDHFGISAVLEYSQSELLDPTSLWEYCELMLRLNGLQEIPVFFQGHDEERSVLILEWLKFQLDPVSRAIDSWLIRETVLIFCRFQLSIKISDFLYENYGIRL